MRAAGSGALTLRALVTFVVLDLGFRLLGFDRVYRRLLLRRRGPAEAWEEAAGRRQAALTFQAVQRATMLYYRTRDDCLPQALTVFDLLRGQGIPAEICFGVRKFPFGAHTWVESYGEPLDSDPPAVRRLTVIHRAAG